MSLSHEDLLRLIHDTKAVSIWNHAKGPVFWYAASVPGPFYVNTELVVGPALAKRLLQGITDILAAQEDPAARAVELERLLLTAYEETPAYHALIETMAARLRQEFPGAALLSGGERRDWLFSLPLARALALPHLFLFKNGQAYSHDPIAKGTPAIHVADLINNAASFFDQWLPSLAAQGLPCPGTLCVNSRGETGVKRLEANGQKVVALNAIGISSFEKSKETGLIDEATLEELRTYFASPKLWAEKYLMDRPELFDAAHTDAKSFERLQTFFEQDPWGLRPAHTPFFEAMAQAIATRKAKA